MAAERLSMRTIKEILRLKWDCRRSNREIAQSCKIARSTVAECLARATAAGLTWPVPPPTSMTGCSPDSCTADPAPNPAGGPSRTGPRFTRNSDIPA